MQRRTLRAFAFLPALLTVAGGALAAPPAFRGAEGFAAEIDGGRGGQVLKVTTLAASGPGSLQAALDTPGPRIVIFEVSGVIDTSEILIPHGDLTIAGQTAPGAGITLAGRLWAAYDEGVDDIVVRHVRIRPAPDDSIEGDQFDAARFALSAGVLLDHVSISYGIDESLDLYESQDVTVQWSTIERASTEGHPEGQHNYGMINGPDGHRISIHHNLFAHNRNRNPAIANGPAEIVNNVVYDVRHGFIHHNPAAGDFQIVGNTYIRGTEDDLIPFYFDDEDPGGTRYHLADNFIDDPGTFVGAVDNPFADRGLHPSFEDLGVDASTYVATRFDFTGQGAFLRPVAMEPASTAYERVLACAGAFPRDVVTITSLEDLANRAGGWGAQRPADLMAGLTPAAAPADGDGDGIPDARETELGLDPQNPADAGVPDAEGLSALDRHLDALADALTPCGPVGEGGGGGTGAGGSVGGGDGDGDGDGDDDDGSGSGKDGAASDSSGDLEGGCGCSTPGGPPPSGALAGALVLAVAALRRARVRRAPRSL